jgi:hypothetical protein
MEKTNLMWDFLLENEVTTEEALEVGTSVGGYNLETLNYILYSKTGMHDVEQCWTCAKNEFYFNDKVIKEFEL